MLFAVALSWSPERCRSDGINEAEAEAGRAILRFLQPQTDLSPSKNVRLNSSPVWSGRAGFPFSVKISQQQRASVHRASCSAVQQKPPHFASNRKVLP